MISIPQSSPAKKDSSAAMPHRLLRFAVSGKDYAFVIAISVLALIVVMKLWRFDLNIPYAYGGDSLSVSIWSKTIYENGWYLHNPRLGAPMEFSMGDYPVADGLHHFAYKILSWFTPNYVVALNLFFFLTFPLTAVTSLFVFKRFGMSSAAAIVCSVLYSFLPYKFYRNICHLYLVSYYVVPLSILMIVWLYFDKVSIFAPKNEPVATDPGRTRSRLIASIAICLFQGFAGIYYAFFSCYLLLVAGVSSALDRRKLYPVFTAVLFIAVTCTAVVINLFPHLAHRWQHGKNREITQRGVHEAEYFGLKISQLVLPVPNHRVELMAKLENKYDPAGVNENQFSSLGVVGAVGFLALVFQLLRRRNAVGDLVDGLSRLNLFAVLLGTVGGLSALFSVLISPMIRGYNRICVFVAFFAFLMVGLLLDRLSERISGSRAPSWVIYGVLALTLGFGLMDEVPANIRPWSETLIPQFSKADHWKRDAKFFKQVEASMPEKSAVFQYPHMSFPESAPVHMINSYDQARGYLHTESLRWSYPMRGRHVDIVARQLAVKPIEEQVRTLAFGGFDGIFVDRRGYVDHAAEFEAGLSSLLQTEPIVSDDQTMAFFSMIDFAAKLRASMTSGEWDDQVQAAWFSPVASFGYGFHAHEQNGVDSWRWCGSQGKLVIQNPGLEPADVKIEFDCATGHPEEATISLTGSLIEEALSANHLGTRFSKTVTVPPGNHAVVFSSDAKRLESPIDPRQLVFQVRNFRIERLPGGKTPRLASKRE